MYFLTIHCILHQYQVWPWHFSYLFWAFQSSHLHLHFETFMFLPCSLCTVPMNISSLCSIVCIFYSDLFGPLHILAKWLFFWQFLHVLPKAGQFLYLCLLPHLLHSLFVSTPCSDLPSRFFGFTVFTLCTSVSSFSIFIWLDVIFLVLQISMAFSIERSTSVSSLPLNWSSFMPHTVLSRINESCRSSNSQYHINRFWESLRAHEEHMSDVW